jgi:hypothetical protein
MFHGFSQRNARSGLVVEHFSDQVEQFLVLWAIRLHVSLKAKHIFYISAENGKSKGTYMQGFAIFPDVQSGLKYIFIFTIPNPSQKA